MGKDDLEPAGVGDAPTAPIFTALAAALAAIENGSIEQAEIEWNRTTQTEEGESTDVLSMTVYRQAQPRFGTIARPPQPEE
jgi:hypothetical protein